MKGKEAGYSILHNTKYVWAIALGTLEKPDTDLEFKGKFTMKYKGVAKPFAQFIEKIFEEVQMQEVWNI